jgi:glycosyltransferase involved in cell wall biosynthesis
MLARYLAEKGYRVCVFTDTPTHMPAADAALGFEIIRGAGFGRMVSGARRADFSVLMGLSLWGAFATFLSGKSPLVHHANAYWSSHPIRRYLERFKVFLLRYCTNVYPSEFLRSYVGVPGFVVPNPYNSDVFYRREVAVDRDVVFCGRLVHLKGVHLLIEALPDIMSERGATSLTVIGEGPELERLKHLARDGGLLDKVHFTGALHGDHLAETLSRHKVMVVPTIWEETFGIVALEGLACCSAVVVSRLGALKEAVGRFGVLVDPDAKSLAHVVARVLIDLDQGRDVPDGASPDAKRAHLEKHTVPAVCSQYERLMTHGVIPVDADD